MRKKESKREKASPAKKAVSGRREWRSRIGRKAVASAIAFVAETVSKPVVAAADPSLISRVEKMSLLSLWIRDGALEPRVRLAAMDVHNRMVGDNAPQELVQRFDEGSWARFKGAREGAGNGAG